MAQLAPRITGTGYSLPGTIRKNDDPIFDSLKAKYPDQQLFTGYDTRHVLADGEDLLTLMVPAARMAIENAGISPAEIDLLIGLGSISEYIAPNVLSGLHKELGLPERAWSIPVGDDFSNFASSIFIADALLKTKRVKHVLICLGCNWSRNVDYKTMQAFSAGDGAGAAVMTMSKDPACWYMEDQQTVMATNWYGAMFTGSDTLAVNTLTSGIADTYSKHYFQITAEGQKGFKDFGATQSLTSVTKLLKKNNLTAKEIAFMPHQTSATLIDIWMANLKPGQKLTTILNVANVTVATHALNFAWFNEKQGIKKDKLVMMALGPDMHANAMLLKRG